MSSWSTVTRPPAILCALALSALGWLSATPAAHAVTAAPARIVVDKQVNVDPIGDSMADVLKNGQPFTCDPWDETPLNPEVGGPLLPTPACHVFAKIVIRKSAATYLGLSSTVIAFGPATRGPVTAWVGNVREQNVYYVPLHPSFIRRVQAKHVVAMNFVTISAAGTWQDAAPPAGDGVVHETLYPGPDLRDSSAFGPPVGKLLCWVGGALTVGIPAPAGGGRCPS